LNIIVPLDGEVRFTQYISNTPYDINSINFYLQKEPSKLELNYIDENEFSQKYEMALEKKVE
jgi:hypothetical protein